MPPTFSFDKKVIPALIGLTCFFATAAWGKVGILLLSFFVAAILLAEWLWGFLIDHRGLPYACMIPAPLLVLFYSSTLDFRIRVFSFFIICFIAAFTALRPRFRFSLDFSSLGRRLAFVSLLLFLFALLLYRQGIYLSGDEPHYLLISQSLVEDGDIDLKNNMEGRTYLSFHPVELEFHGSQHKGKWVPFHMPGLSLLLVPFYWLYSRLLSFIPPQLFFRWVAGLLNILFALGLYRLLKKSFPGREWSATWLLLITTFPFLFHGLHLFPELPAGTLLLLAYLRATDEEKSQAWTGWMLAVIPWFHVKYILPAGILALWLIVRLAKRKAWGSGLRLLSALAVGWFSLGIYSKLFYESFNPNAIFPPADYFAASFASRVETFLAFFLDQRDGLLIYAPFILFLFLGFRKPQRHRGLLLSIFFSYLCFHAFTTVRGAYSPAGRPVMFVYWIACLFIANYLSQKPPDAPARSFRLNVGLSYFSLAWLAYFPLFVYQPVTAGTTERASRLLAFLGSRWLDLTPHFPSFLKRSNAGHPASFLWPALLLLLLILYYSRAHSRLAKLSPTLTAGLITAIFGFTLCFWPHVHLSYARCFAGKNLAFFNNSRNFIFLEDRRLFRVKAGSSYDLFLDLRKTRARAIEISIDAGGSIPFRLCNGRRLLLQSTGTGPRSLLIRPETLAALNVRGFRVAPLTFSLPRSGADAFLFLKIAAR